MARDRPVLADDDEADEATADLVALHEAAPDNVGVALRGGEVVGVAAAPIRERHRLLHSLFVVPPAQHRGLGKELLRGIHAAGVAGCDVFSLHASSDPAALTCCLALGLAPTAADDRLGDDEPDLSRAALG